MNIRKIEQGKKCHYCREPFNGVEEGLVQILPNGEESYYHLRCVGKLMVYRIEGVLPKHLFTAVVDELNKPLPIEETGQTTLNDFHEEE
tara:strand:+ start:8258 stop:8524 length:267 start_codon:yes stop_codon:yes gene_type:complete